MSNEFSQEEMERMQREAMERVRQMQSRAQRTVQQANQDFFSEPSKPSPPPPKRESPLEAGRPGMHSRRTELPVDLPRRGNPAPPPHKPSPPRAAPAPAPSGKSVSLPAELPRREKGRPAPPPPNVPALPQKQGIEKTNPLGGFLSRFLKGMDGDTALILGMLLILSSQKSDEKLMMALAYILL